MPHCYIHNDVEVPPEALETHHKWPRVYGGPDTDDNLMYLCSTCHSICHRLSHKIYAGKSGVAKTIVDQYLPGQPKRQLRLLELAETVARARLAHKRSAKMPNDDQKENVDTILVSFELPYWVHHRLKTLSAGRGLYRYINEVLEKHVVVATNKPGAPDEELYAVAEPQAVDRQFFLLKPDQ